MNAILQELMDELGLSEDEAVARLSGWDVIPVQSGDHVVGHLAKQGSEVHTTLLPEFRSKPMTAVIKTYRKLMKDCVFLTTRCPLDDTVAQSLSERVGFRETRRDDEYVYFWMDETTLIGGKKHAT